MRHGPFPPYPSTAVSGDTRLTIDGYTSRGLEVKWTRVSVVDGGLSSHASDGLDSCPAAFPPSTTTHSHRDTRVGNDGKSDRNEVTRWGGM